MYSFIRLWGTVNTCYAWISSLTFVYPTRKQTDHRLGISVKDINALLIIAHRSQLISKTIMAVIDWHNMNTTNFIYFYTTSVWSIWTWIWFKYIHCVHMIFQLFLYQNIAEFNFCFLHLVSYANFNFPLKFCCFAELARKKSCKQFITKFLFP